MIIIWNKIMDSIMNCPYIFASILWWCTGQIMSPSKVGSDLNEYNRLADTLDDISNRVEIGEMWRTRHFRKKPDAYRWLPSSEALGPHPPSNIFGSMFPQLFHGHKFRAVTSLLAVILQIFKDVLKYNWRWILPIFWWTIDSMDKVLCLVQCALQY